MKISEIVGIVCKMLAIYVLIHLVSMFQIILPANMRIYEQLQFFPIVSSILYLLLFFLLWFRSNWIVKAIVNKDHEIETTKMTSQHLQSILFSTVGVLILANVIPQITQAIFQTVFESSALGVLEIKSPLISLYSGMFVKLAIGLWLLFGAKGLIGLLNRKSEQHEE